MNYINQLGQIGEVVAANYLQQKGFQVVEKNWRYHYKEIDIIAKNNEILLIIEVKARNFFSAQILAPFASVTKRKQRLLIDAANAYVTMHNIDCEIRFDIISIIFKSQTDFTIEHIEDAFYPFL